MGGRPVTERALDSADIPALDALAARSGFPYPKLDDPHVEAVRVVVDSQGRVLMACAAKRVTELYLYVGEGTPVTKMGALRLLHRGMAQELRQLGYSEVNVQLPPPVAAKFGRRLQRSFGWMRNHWENWFIRF